MDQQTLTLLLAPESTSEHWLESFVAALRPRQRGHSQEQLEWYCQALEKRPALAEEVRTSAWSFLQVHDLRTLLCEAGVNWGHNLFDSIVSRLLGKILPPPPRAGSLQHAVRLAFDRRGDGDWLRQWSDSPDPCLDRLSQLLAVPSDHPVMQKCRIEVLSSLEILSHRLAAMGLDTELVRVAPDLEKYANPFLAQTHELADLMKALSAGDTLSVAEEAALAGAAEAANDAHLNVLLQQCTEILSRVQKQAKQRGTSLHLTYHLVTADAIIERMHVLSRLITGRLSQVEVWRFMLSLCLAEHSRHSIRDLSRQQARIIALQVVHQAGHTGEHYIAHNKEQLRGLFLAALGGGFVVAIMSVVKTDTSMIPDLAPLLLTLGYCLNYSLGFVILHLLGFSLATKQPAMTAAALAEAIPDHKKIRNSSLDEVADLCLLTARSQFAAIAGNVLLAFPTALLLSVLWKWQSGVPIAPPDKAAHLMAELTPGWSILFAAIAGVGLYLSGLVSGYCDNLCDFYAVPDRIRHSPQLLRWLGGRAEVWARTARDNTGAIAGSIFLGVYLGLMSSLVPILGIPLNIRHVTFSAANLGLALHAEGFHAYTFTIALVGIALIGLTNLFVSFGLALWTAASARGVGKRNGIRLIQAVIRRIRVHSKPTGPEALMPMKHKTDRAVTGAALP